MESTLLIGHLDAGPSPNHQFFNSRIVQSITFDKVGNIEIDLPSTDSKNHSSLTSRIIFDDKLYSLPPLSSTVKYIPVSVSTHGKNLLNLLKGMDFLIGRSPKVVCMPFGFRKQTPIFYPMICSFFKNGILPIAPIGNKGEGKTHSPGCYSGVISVGALDEKGNVTHSSGSFLDESSNCLKPDIMAPGSFPLGSQQQKKNGTSFACAYVSGLVARMLQTQPDATCEELKQALFSTTLILPTEQNHRCKKGIVQPDAALKSLLQNKKVASSFEMESIPSFLKETFRDARFLSQFKNAKPEDLIEAIIIPDANSGNSMATQDSSILSQNLISEIQKTTGLSPDSCYYFVHADMAHITAQISFFEALLNHPSLFAISAVDVNIFEM